MSIRERLEAIGNHKDDAISLVDAALVLSAWGISDLDLGPYYRHIANLTDDVVAYVHDDKITATLACEAARQVLSRRYGYAGTLESHEQGDGANLARVIDKRRGDALALSILYHHVLRHLGMTVEILNFPTHALVRIEDPFGRRLVIDPLRDGRTIDARTLRELYRKHRGGAGDLNPFTIEPYTRRGVLVGLLDQIKAFHLRHAAPEAALATLEAALLVAPNTPRLWREAGLLHARLDHVGDAISALQRFLDLPSSDVHRYTASQLLQQLQSRQDKNTP